ncbi:universal stress protein [Acinetobacter junii]|jgi:nucleotide-binding universal stress UspA family protein|uniref:Universal stress protein n=4 Tax=Acinetobacter junii TaxID=40215 RepID=A0A2R4UML9_ACIJU|nr:MULTISPECIES: universal stress protein [Acinetobacter]MBY3627003.1 universal stress protein [Acinetobacter sp. CUI P1]APU49438.1 universal stress protein [Acinetobacter junii]ATU46024.1 universal stress protein [Acinetobacter junii]AWA47297.1 universal stress protein [Acinetobacter junii]EEY93059.1 universal stress family protein [Acinetobacter junii SH205]
MAYQKILVAIDDSEISANVIQQAAQLAKALNSQITLVQVMTLDPYLADAYLRMGQSNELIERVRSYVQENLTKAQKQFEELGQTVATQVVEGFSVHEEIIKAAQNLEVDLIIMGSHGRTGFKKFILGSVAQKVLGESHIPVLIVR